MEEGTGLPQDIPPASPASPNITKTSTEGTPSAARRHWFLPTLLSVFAAVVLFAAIYRMPAPVRTFVALSAVAGILVVGGLTTLIVLIPAAGSNPEVKTEFYSARAAYLCVIAGLLLFAVVTIGAVFARVMLSVHP